MKKIISLLLSAGIWIQAYATEDSLAHKIKLAFNAGDDAQVVKLAENIENANWDTESNHYYILALMADDLDEAEDAANEALERFPNEYNLYMTHATVMGAQASDSIFSALGYAEKALNSLETAVKVAPDEPLAHLSLLGFHLNAPSIAGGDMDEAKKIVGTIQSLDEELGALANIRYINASDEDFEPALDKALAQFPQSGAILNYAASAYTRNEQHEKAYAIYEKITQLDSPQSADKDTDVDAFERFQTRRLNATYQLGRLSLLIENKAVEGIKHLSRFMQESNEISARKRDLPNQNWVNLRLSELYLHTKQMDLAKSTFALISLEDEKDFKRAYKALKKKL